MPDLIQRLAAMILLVLTAPIQLGLAFVVRLDSPGPAWYVSDRMGQGGRTFRLLKIRTMCQDADVGGPGITIARDPRVTRVGRVLRRIRLDELPQLWNVVRGDMRLVGPRPEDPRYFDPSDPLHALVFHARPGITGATQLLFMDEAKHLAGADPEEAYRVSVLPAKVQLDAAYLRCRSARLDAWIVLWTIMSIGGRPPQPAEVLARLGTTPCSQGDQGAGRGAATS